MIHGRNKKNKIHLSKSKYCSGMQCPKILWMDRNMPEQKADFDDSRMIVGNIVGDMAMGYFGEYTEVPFNRSNIGEMIKETTRLLEEGTEIIAEASFSIDGNFCSVDILRKDGDSYEIIEVKSSSAILNDKKDKISYTYYNDMAYQYYVLNKCGLNISKVSLMRINKEFVKEGEIDIQKFFIITDCTDIVVEMQKDIPDNIAIIRDIATAKSEPISQIGGRCNSPYACGYKAWCFRNLPENNVFEIGWRMSQNDKDYAFNNGIITFEDIANSNIKLNDKPRLQVETVINNLPPHIEKEKIEEFINGLTYPLYHLDFETIQQAIPLWDGLNPYRQIPFQFSLHIQETPCSEAKHIECLCKEGEDPRREIAERLCNDIPKNVCVLAYSASFEQGCIKNLAKDFPDLAEHLMNIHDNIKDLADPFQNTYYYCREMRGKYSIKSVLPALCSDDPELDYNKLDLVHNGSEAMTIFANLHEKPPEEIAKIRAALLAYCKLDTLAMVKILEKLYESVGN